MALIISIFIISSETIPFTIAENQTATSPVRTLGDKWTYRVNYGQTSGMTGTTTNEITSTSVSVSSYDCTEFTLTGGGTTSGQGTWTTNGTQYETKTDYSTPKSEITLDTKTSTFNETITTITDYNLPMNNSDFPFYVGKNWTATTTQTLTTKHILNGVLTEGKDSQKTTFNFTVLRSEDVTVPAGKFQTFVIRMTNDGGSSSEIYYSTKANMQVKELDYFQDGNLAFSSELLSYNVAVPMSTSTPAATPTSQLTNVPTQLPTRNPTTNPTASTSTNPTSTPTVPEFPALAILPLFALVLLLMAFKLRHRKTVKWTFSHFWVYPTSTVRILKCL